MCATHMHLIVGVSMLSLVFDCHKWFQCLAAQIKRIILRMRQYWGNSRAPWKEIRTTSHTAAARATTNTVAGPSTCKLIYKSL